MHQQQQGQTIALIATGTRHCNNTNRDQPLYQQQQGPSIASTLTGAKHCINSNKDQPLYQQQEAPTITSTASSNDQPDNWSTATGTSQ